jgi:serine/threonine-protein kinase
MAERLSPRAEAPPEARLDRLREHVRERGEGSPRRVGPLLNDQEAGWRAGQPLRAEAYLDLLGAAEAFSEDGFDLIYGEWVLRRERGEAPDLADYQARFPAYAEELRKQVCLDEQLSSLPGPEGGLGSSALPVPDGAAAVGAGPVALERYQVLTEVAQGGMGRVFRGRDTVLDRPLALKVLRDEHRGRASMVQRFLLEARTCGQLQHPGIVPLHDLGTLPDGRPFFAMKLVEGQTLAALLAARADPAQDRPRLLKVLEQVCQAVAYAHSKGVLHRDLKPANVMVGAFGEVQVMDWGLAKVLGLSDGDTGASPPGPGEADSRDTDGAGPRTEAGTALGTPAYMAPEQARGELERLDARCDVFGLGAILCELLTGRPPYGGGNGAAILSQAAHGELGEAAARLEACGADAELVGLAKRCLAAERDDRPRTAGEVAGALTDYLAGVEARLRAAELERAAAEAQVAEARAKAAAERRARRWQLGLAAAVLALVGLAAGGGLWLEQLGARARQDWEQRRDRARHAVAVLLRQVVEPRLQGRWAEAEAVLTQAEDRLPEADSPELREQVAQARADLRMVKRLEEARLGKPRLVSGEVDTAPAGPAFSQAFTEHGLDVFAGGAEGAAEQVRRSAVREQLVAALDHWAVVEKDGKRQERLLDVARQADPGTWSERFRDLAVWGDRVALEKLVQEADVAKLSPQLLAALGIALRRHEDRDWQKWRLEVARRAGPGEWRARFLNPAVWEDPAAQARLTQEADGAKLPRQLLAARGTALRRLSVPFLKEAQRRHPNDFWLNFFLGNALLKGAPQEAVGYYRAALALRQHVSVYNDLGIAYANQGQLDDAIAAYKEATRLSEKKHYQPYYGFGLALAKNKQWGDAIAPYRQAIALRKDFTSAHYELGIALAETGKLDGAILEFKEAIRCDKQLGEAYNQLGRAYLKKRRWDDAVAVYRKFLDIDKTVAPAHNDLGYALEAAGKVQEAIDAYEDAIRLKPDYAKAHNNLGNALMQQKQLALAICSLHRAVELDPEYAKAYANLAFAFQMKGQPDKALAPYREAIKHFRKAVHVQPGLAKAYLGLGGALFQGGQFPEALGAFQRGRDLLQPGDPLRQPLSQTIHWAEVLSGQAQPANDAVRVELAQLCQRQEMGRYVSSARLWRAAFASNSRLADHLEKGHRYNAARAAARAGCGQGHDAPQLGEKERAGWRKQALDWLRADLALRGKQLKSGPPGAVGAARKALEHWERDSDLAGLRDKGGLAKLPAAERAEWEKFWAEVAALRQKAPQGKVGEA